MAVPVASGIKTAGFLYADLECLLTQLRMGQGTSTAFLHNMVDQRRVLLYANEYFGFAGNEDRSTVTFHIL